MQTFLYVCSLYWANTARLRGLLPLLFVLFSSQFASAQGVVSVKPIAIPANSVQPNAPESIEIFEDETSSFNYTSIQRAIEWKTISGNAFNQGFSQSSWWIRFKVVAEQAGQYVIALNNPLLEDVEAWIIDQSDPTIFEHYVSGSANAFSTRPIESRRIIFPLALINNQEKTILLKVASDTSLALPLEVWPEKAYHRLESEKNVLFGIFIGAVFFTLLYNFLLFVSTRDVAFLYYVFYVLPLGLTAIVFEGWGKQYFWPNTEYVNSNMLGFFFLSNMLGMLAFTKVFLQVNNLSEKFNYAFNSLIGLTAVIWLLTILGVKYSSVILFAIPLFVATTLASFLAGILSYRRGNYLLAKYFLIARSMLLGGGIILISARSGVFQTTAFTEGAVQIGTALEALFLSFALANKINVERQLRLKEQKNTIEAKAETRAKTRFLASMSHEIRTPMNGIIGITQLLWDTKLNAEQKEYVGIIKSSGKSLLYLINEILDLSKIDAGKLNLENIEFKTQELVSETNSMFQYEAKRKNVNLKLDIEESLPEVLEGDPTRIKQILINFIGNALKFTEKGCVAITMRLETVEEITKNRPEILNKLESTGAQQFLYCAVSDTGLGISKSRANALFEAFEQADTSTSREYGGSGLGLTICKQLVRLMEGEIGVNSEVGQGSTFWFIVPISLVTKPKQIIPPKKLMSPTNGKKSLDQFNIMLVEDNQVNQIVAKGLLTKLGVDPIVVDSGEKALDYVKQNHLNLDLIFMDCEMPGMDGFECTKLIREYESLCQLNALPIYALTAHAMREHIDKCLAVGMDGHVPKPINSQLLRDVIDQIINNAN